MEHRLTCAAGVAFYSIWDRMQGKSIRGGAKIARGCVSWQSLVVGQKNGTRPKVRISGQLFIVPVPYGLMSRGVPK
jgi:hypothetical protein